MAPGLSRGKGEGTKFGVGCWGKWGTKGIAGEAENEWPVLLGSL